MLPKTRVMMVCLCALVSSAAQAQWTTILSEDFSNPAAHGWAYTGPAGEALLSAAGGVLQAEWDMDRGLDRSGDPWVFENAYYHRSLGCALTDANSFRFGATLQIASIVNTTTFYEVANFGLYDLAHQGADRGFADDYSGNTTLVDNPKNFVEFNYFIGTAYNGRNIQPTIAASQAGQITSGSSTDPMWHDSYLGEEALPTDTDLYVEVTYSADTRRAKAALYSDEARTNLLTVDVGGMDVEVYYWTQALPEDQHFTLTDLAFVNYATQDWMGYTDGGGMGSFDNLFVQVPEPVTLLLLGVGALGLRRRRR